MKPISVDRIVARKTKGLAFKLDYEEYMATLKRVRTEVSEDLKTLPDVEFRKKYKDWMW